jgi:excinuclease UvrABC nuclease subunit
MERAATELRFEEAAKLRDDIRALERILGEEMLNS